MRARRKELGHEDTKVAALAKRRAGMRGARCPLEIYQFLEPLLALLAARRRDEKRIAALAT
jgi:hypothetical protein